MIRLNFFKKTQRGRQIQRQIDRKTHILRDRKGQERGRKRDIKIDRKDSK